MVEANYTRRCRDQIGAGAGTVDSCLNFRIAPGTEIFAVTDSVL